MNQLISQLYDWGGIRLTSPGESRGFRWKVHSHYPKLMEAPLYFDMRGYDSPKPGTLPSEAFDIIGAAMAEYYFCQPEALLSPIIVGVPYAADPLASGVVKSQPDRKLRQLWLFKREHGPQRVIESIAYGDYQVGDEVVLFENAVSLGYSIEEAVGVLREDGLVVRQVVTFVDMELGGRERLDRLGCQLFSMFTTSEVLRQLIAGRPEVDRSILSHWQRFRQEVGGGVVV